MKILEKEFKATGFYFKQVRRVGDKAIYVKKSLSGRAKSIEVIMIKSHTGYHLAGTYIAPAETYPSNSQWGTFGWTFNCMEKAMKKFNSIKTTIVEKPISKAVRVRSRA